MHLNKSYRLFNGKVRQVLDGLSVNVRAGMDPLQTTELYYRVVYEVE
jgi:hypothetical protein